jgi:sugar O-acyltransferase (sialic acid O-acetyltransferase NeuD family)
MLIAGAKGFAKQLLDVIFQLGLENGLVFYDDYDPLLTALFEFPVLKTVEDASDYFLKKGPDFVLGTGNPVLRETMKKRLEQAGGNCISLISPQARIARYCEIGKGSTILTGAVVENGAIIGEGVLLNLNALVCHDCRIGDFVEISPGSILTGGCMVGDGTFIGSGAVVKPGIRIGNQAIIAAGSVLIRDVPDKAMVAGVPAEIKAQH